MERKLWSAAFTVTLPVLIGYLFIGVAFGLMLNAAGYGFFWALAMSLTIYAGSAQYMGVGLLAAGAPLPQVAMLTLMINFRHFIYGLSMLDKFRGMGRRKLYMIFSLTDETYALLSGISVPPGMDPRRFYFAVSLLDQSYWVAGSLLGSAAGFLFRFNTRGIEFAMTALFLVILTDQWRDPANRVPALLGGSCTLASLLLFGPGSMLPPALCAIVASLLLLRRRLDKPAEAEEEEEISCR